MRAETKSHFDRPTRPRLKGGLAIGLTLAGILVLLAIVAPVIWGNSGTMITDYTNLSPSTSHPLGTDSLGRDMLARSLTAVRLTLIMAAGACAISVVGGALIGTSIWLAPRRIRETGLRLVEVAVSYPSILTAIIIAAILGAGTWSAVLAIGIAGIPAFARLTSNMAASVSQQEYISTARLLGVPPHRVLYAHLLPNMAEPVLIMTAAGFATALVEIAGLSFIGLGVQSPSYDFGRLLVDAIPAIYTRPVQIAGPVIMIVLTGLAATLIGDGLAARANVRTRGVTANAPSPSTNSSERRNTTPGNPAALVEVRNLRVATVGGAEIVKDINFDINHGEILGVVGESGSGKSITAMALARLLPVGLVVEADALRIAEMDLRSAVVGKELATNLALIYQDPGTTFNPALRLGAQLTEVLTRHLGFSRSDARQRIVDELSTVHVSLPKKRLRQHPYELSGGMRQRTMIASALATDPVLLIADEPTTALDVTVQAEIIREFRRINTDNGMSILFISHDLGVVGELCDRVLVMRSGEIVEELTAEELMADTARHPYTQKLIAATPHLIQPTTPSVERTP